MKKTAIILALICMMMPGLSQLFAQSQLEFKETTHDFGTIREADGSVTYQFSFTNIGKSDVEINYVKAT